jgi:serine/threonine-protein kinase RsbW
MFFERVITLIIESKIDNIVLLSKAVRAICSSVVSDETILYNLELCLVEATSNVIEHGYHRKPGNLVEVCVTVDDNHVIIQIIDSGDKIPHTISKRKLDYDCKDVTNLPESGIGLFLIQSLMDEVSFDQQGGKNVIMMRKNLNPKNP